MTESNLEPDVESMTLTAAHFVLNTYLFDQRFLFLCNLFIDNSVRGFSLVLKTPGMA